MFSLRFLVALSLPLTFSRVAALPDGVISTPLHRIKNETAYGVELYVGTPPQRVVVLADTGSPTYAVESPVYPVCKRGLCDLYGTYDNTTSSTTRWISSDYNDVLIDHGYGSYVNDTIRLKQGGRPLENMNFGVMEGNTASFPITDEQAAIFGLGALCVTKACNSYPTFLQQLLSHGVIAKRAFSVYLGPNDPKAQGTLLFGGVDRAKRDGPIHTLPMLDPTTNQAFSSPNFVKTMSLELRKSDGQTMRYSYGKDGKGKYTLLDTGSPRWYLPKPIFSAVMDAFGLPHNVDTSDGRVHGIDCKFRRPSQDKLIATFSGHAGADAVVEVPLHYLVTKLGNDCVSDIEPGIGAWGDAFLRGTYVSFDYDELEVRISEVNFTEETDIARIR